MNKNVFRGWNQVYGFTLSQTTKKKGFRTLTILISLLLFGAVVLAVILTAKPEASEPGKEEGNTGTIGTVKEKLLKEVYLYDETKISVLEDQKVLEQVVSESFSGLNFYYDNASAEEAAAKAAKSEQAIAVVIQREAENISGQQVVSIKAAIPEGSLVKKQEAQQLLSVIAECFESNVMQQAGLSEEQLAAIQKGIVVNTKDLGEEKSTAVMLIEVFAPMIFGLLLYFLLLFYGQTICKEVSLEKTSKLVETLLISVQPYGMITGKVLAVTVSALGQFFLWVASAILGLFVGNAAAGAMYPGYTNSIVEIVGFLRDNIGETAMSVPSVLLAVIIFCAGFLFFNVLAALAGCLVTRPEETASTQALFQFPIIISWLISYFSFLLDNKGLIALCRYLPFTAPFGVPVELLTGTVGIGQGLISAGLLLLFSFLIIWFAAKVYKGLILYQGEKVTPAKLLKIVRAK